MDMKVEWFAATVGEGPTHPICGCWFERSVEDWWMWFLRHCFFPPNLSLLS